jgi:hypothetical protein
MLALRRKTMRHVPKERVLLPKSLENFLNDG